MDLFELPEDRRVELVRERETGMGYQVGRLISGTGREIPGIFLAGRYFVPDESEDLKNNVAQRDLSKLLLLEAPPARAAAIQYGSRLTVKTLSPAATRPTALSAQPVTGQPPHRGTTAAGDVFYRVSAFKNDWRVRHDGSLAPGSYVTTDTDITVVPNGLAAVGRYALPTRISSRYLFEIKPGAGYPILFGTVTPNFGLAGGGVEVLFPIGTKPGSVGQVKTIPEK